MTADNLSSALQSGTALRTLDDTALMETSPLSTTDQRLDVLQTLLEERLGSSAVDRLLALLSSHPAELPFETSIIKAVGAKAFVDNQGEINQFMVCWKLNR
eukprot:m.25688 g.25688  ORF g.25688 m.25688 type:complete len:101 (-) comp11620_c0_seq2:119-421(-)